MVMGQETQQATATPGPDTEGTERGWQTQQSATHHLPKNREAEVEHGAGSRPGDFWFSALQLTA